MRGRVAAAVTAIALCVAGPSLGHDRAALGVVPWRSRAAMEWEAHRTQPIDPNPRWSFVMPLAGAPVRTEYEVLGFLPSWNIHGDVFPALRLDRLTTVAYFAVEVHGDGTLGDAGHWGTPGMAPLMDAAHAAGVRVVLTVTCFYADTMGALLASPTARAKAVSGLVAAVSAAGGDGVNVDFEGLPSGSKAGFVAFVGELKAALDGALGASHVTVDTPAIDWLGTYDYDALALAGDGLVIMGYDYHYKGGDPGPVAPLATADPASKLSLTWTLDDYDAWGGVANRGRFLLALPLYGYDWPVAADVMPATATGDATPWIYADCGIQAAAVGGWRWDDVSATPWIGYSDGGGPRQLWCENLDSLTAKASLAAGRNLAGVAWWALGNEDGSDDPWTALDRAYPPPPVEPVPDEPGDAATGVDAAEVDGPDPEVPSDDVPPVDDFTAPVDVGGDAPAVDVPVDADPSDPGRSVPDSVSLPDPGTIGGGRSGGGSCSATAGAAPRPAVPVAAFGVLAMLIGACRIRRRAGPRGPTCP